MFRISFIAIFLLVISFLQACKQKGTDSLPDTEEEMRMEENPFSKVPGVAEQNSGGNSSQNQNQENNPTSDKAYWEKLDKDLGVINIAPTSIENSKDKIHSIHISKDRKTAKVYYKSLPLVEELPVVHEKGANILEILMPTVKKSIINGKESDFMQNISAKKNVVHIINGEDGKKYVHIGKLSLPGGMKNNNCPIHGQKGQSGGVAKTSDTSASSKNTSNPKTVGKTGGGSHKNSSGTGKSNYKPKVTPQCACPKHNDEKKDNNDDNGHEHHLKKFDNWPGGNNFHNHPNTNNDSSDDNESPTDTAARQNEEMHKRVDAQGFIWFNNLMGELQENHKDVPQMISDWSIRQVVLNKFNDDCHASSKANKAKHEKWEEDHKYSFDYFYENWFLIFESAEKAGVIEDNIKYTKDFVDYSLFPNDFKDDISDYISRIKKLKNEVKSQYREAKKLAKCVDASIFMEDDAGLNSEGKGLLERAQGKAKSTLEAPGKAKNLIPDLDNLSSEVKDLIKINNKDPKDYGYDNDGYESDIENDYNQDQLGSLIKTCDNGASAQATKIKDILAIQMPGLIKKLGGKQNASIDDFVDSLLSSKELQDQILNCINNNGNIVQLYQDICSAIMQNLPNPPGMAFEITEFNEITKRFNKLRKAIRDVIKIVSNKMQEENLGVSISNNSNNYPSDADDEGEHFKEEKKGEKGIGIKEEKKRDKDVEIIKKDVSVTDNYVDTLIYQLEGYKVDLISGEKKLSLDKLKDHLERLEACKNEIKADYRATDKKHLKLPKPKKDEKTKKTTNTKEIKEAKEKIESDMQEKKDKMTKLRAIRAVLEEIIKANAPEGFFQGHKEPSSDEDYDLHNGMKIPKLIKLKNGKEVKINFGVSKSDNRSADNQVNEKLVKALTDALNIAGNSVDITEITISCTTNGQHADCSNHDVIQDARAFDISGINGKSVVSIKPNDPVIKALQNAFESLPNIRENFGPCYMHKEKEPYGIDNKKLQEQHMDHLHVSINP